MLIVNLEVTSEKTSNYINIRFCVTFSDGNRKHKKRIYPKVECYEKEKRVVELGGGFDKHTMDHLYSCYILYCNEGKE